VDRKWSKNTRSRRNSPAAVTSWAGAPPARRGPRTATRSAVALAVALACVWVASGCGVGGGDRTPAHRVAGVRVGDVALSRAEIDHWQAVLANGGATLIAVPDGAQSSRRALEFLIAAQWTIGQAAALDVEPGPAAVARAQLKRERASPGGTTEFREALATTGETKADVEFQVRAMLSREALRRVLDGFPAATSQSGSRPAPTASPAGRQRVRLLESWRARWKARTICGDGYVIRWCRAAPGTPPEPFEAAEQSSE
jgi:hypothetical protein